MAAAFSDLIVNPATKTDWHERFEMEPWREFVTIPVAVGEPAARTISRMMRADEEVLFLLVDQTDGRVAAIPFRRFSGTDSATQAVIGSDVSTQEWVEMIIAHKEDMSDVPLPDGMTPVLRNMSTV